MLNKFIILVVFYLLMFFGVTYVSANFLEYSLYYNEAIFVLTTSVVFIAGALIGEEAKILLNLVGNEVYRISKDGKITKEEIRQLLTNKEILEQFKEVVEEMIKKWYLKATLKVAFFYLKSYIVNTF